MVVIKSQNYLFSLTAPPYLEVISRILSFLTLYQKSLKIRLLITNTIKIDNQDYRLLTLNLQSQYTPSFRWSEKGPKLIKVEPHPLIFHIFALSVSRIKPKSWSDTIAKKHVNLHFLALLKGPPPYFHKLHPAHF